MGSYIALVAQWVACIGSPGLESRVQALDILHFSPVLATFLSTFYCQFNSWCVFELTFSSVLTANKLTYQISDYKLRYTYL